MSKLKHVVSTDRAPAPFQGAPYSQGIIFGDLVFVAGQVALDPETYTVVEGGIEEQTERRHAEPLGDPRGGRLRAEAAPQDDIFLADFDDFAAMNEVYGKSRRPGAAGTRHGAGRVSPQRRAGRDRRDRAPVTARSVVGREDPGQGDAEVQREVGRHVLVRLPEPDGSRPRPRA